MTDPVTLTQELVRCPSITPVDAGAQNILIARLEKLGFTVTRLKFGDIENFFARLGTQGPHLCYAGHTDVVPAGDASRWKHPPFSATIENGALYGRGTSDMKASNAAFLCAVERHLQSEQKINGSVSFLITGDEEGPAVDGTVRVLEWMDQNGHIPDFAVVGEPTNPETLGDEIKIGRRGSQSIEITVLGKQGHVAYPDRADNAATKITRVLSALMDLKLDVGTTHFPPTSLVVTSIDIGNATYNLIPERAVAKLNIRYNDTWTPETLTQRIREAIENITPDYTLKIVDGANVFLTHPGPMTALVQQAVADITGRIPALATGGGTSDARFFARYCPVVECGPVNATIHKTDENIDLKTLEDLTRIYEAVLKRFYA